MFIGLPLHATGWAVGVDLDGKNVKMRWAQKPTIIRPKANFTKSFRGFKCCFNHWLTFRSNIRAQNWSKSVKIPKTSFFCTLFIKTPLKNHVFNFPFAIFWHSKFHLTSPWSSSTTKLCYWKAEKCSTSRLPKPPQM